VICQAQFVESPAISKFPKTGTSFRAQSRNLSEQDRRLPGGFSTLLEATCPGNFEIEGPTRQIVVDAALGLRETGLYPSRTKEKPRRPPRRFARWGTCESQLDESQWDDCRTAVVPFVCLCRIPAIPRLLIESIGRPAPVRMPRDGSHLVVGFPNEPALCLCRTRGKNQTYNEKQKARRARHYNAVSA